MSDSTKEPAVKQVESLEEERAAAEAAWKEAMTTHGSRGAMRAKVVADAKAAWIARGGHTLVARTAKQAG